MLPEAWQGMRREVEAANWVLTAPLYSQLFDLFLRLRGSGELDLRNLTREWEREEFLLGVDDLGQPVLADSRILADFHAIADLYPDLRRWFQEEQVAQEQEAGVLMPGRWLCHLLGLRHRTVEIFIDPPNWDGYTLVQVRSLDKHESPGSFDIPCAGHITGMDGVEQALVKELGEELNLGLDDFSQVEMLGEYNSPPVWGDGLLQNHEYRFLFRAGLKPESAAKIRFADGEVAGLCVFSVVELRDFVKQFPERVAGGLLHAIDHYR